MSDPSSSPHHVAQAMQWVSRVTSIVAVMVVPGLAGQWLDRRYGFQVFALAGFAFGLTVAIWQLVLMARKEERRRKARTQDDHDHKEPES